MKFFLKILCLTLLTATPGFTASRLTEHIELSVNSSILKRRVMTHSKQSLIRHSCFTNCSHSFSSPFVQKRFYRDDFCSSNVENNDFTYPNEWPPNKFKDFVLDYLKNITEESEKKIYPHTSLYNILVPLVFMGKRDYSSARNILIEQNGDLPLLEQDNRRDDYPESLRNILTIIDSSKDKNTYEFAHEIIPYVRDIDVTPLPESHPYKKGGYHYYYRDKKEDFSFESQEKWEDKQKNVSLLLTQLRPKKVLDIGANMGWLSKLAEYLDAEVVATDIDEYCMDFLYKEARDNNLNISPSVIPFEDFIKRKVMDRYKSEVVLCLALVHHLSFVRGLPLDKIFETLSDLTEKVLILEYIPPDDVKIKEAFLRPIIFFKNVSDYKKTLNTYKNQEKFFNLSTFLSLGKKYFKSISIMNSFPKGRKLLIFKK